MSMKYSVLTIGKTHSGKTTFGKMLSEQIPDLTTIETDPIGILLNEHYAPLSEDKVHDGKFRSPSLKYKLFIDMIQHAILLQQNVLLTNSNMHAMSRAELEQLFHDAGYKVIFVYLNLPSSLLKERTDSSSRSTAVLKTSNSYSELLDKQEENRFSEPKGSEGDLFITIKNPKGIPKTIEQLSSVLRAEDLTQWHDL